jgi:hypothetical protein
MGQRGALSWGYRDAAALCAWTVTRDAARQFYLRARVERIDSYGIKQIPILFTAPRTSRPRGLWVFPVIPNSIRIAGTVLTAALRPPEGR